APSSGIKVPRCPLRLPPLFSVSFSPISRLRSRAATSRRRRRRRRVLTIGPFPAPLCLPPYTAEHHAAPQQQQYVSRSAARRLFFSSIHACASVLPLVLLLAFPRPRVVPRVLLLPVLLQSVTRLNQCIMPLPRPLFKAVADPSLVALGPPLLKVGMAFGTGSAVAHRAVDAVLGPRTVQHEYVNSEASPAAAAAPVANAVGADACSIHFKAFQDCINSNGSDISKCQFYLDMLNECRQGSGSALNA
ncbi:hypothetical protein Taro_006226, partial [Colocasia esculenta]|nr:hypothetical protein [Colocasia esculenta]